MYKSNYINGERNGNRDTTLKFDKVMSVPRLLYGRKDIKTDSDKWNENFSECSWL